ncbi:dihydrolipoyl dehydrogenase [Opitutaceae bacterium TAV4]|uniref:dihydrolipoyl dehydrogenase n=1 Tax=Geminisphaera colitermitum TaxID=1148786 RepID=UPI0005B85CC2|nr:dihydrolipoyl dehydrogenase [Geminisphaera colitermitum]RRJ96207.1 dihydrolipoyl dehydrogenase [Opitutaceae bacterium TAV4]RRK00347.1 dihydrolipoyl dehydrogenase [Opitutaceae bacterium TAV3]
MQYDLIVIGAGPGGYVCAFRAAQLGLNVALVEKRLTLGGTCLNVGCIPTKALLSSSEHYTFAQKHAAAHGIKLGSVELDLPTLLKKKNDTVLKLTAGVAALAKARKVTVHTGAATFSSPTEISVQPDAGAATTLTAKNIVIATGSAPAELSFLKFDGHTILSSDHAVALDTVPRTLAVIGGGAIGLELGSVWSRLGSDVTIVEALPKIAATADDDIVRLYTRLLAKQGLKIETTATVTGYDPATATLTATRDGQPLAPIPADKVLVAVGRRPYTDGLGLDKIGVTLDDRRRVAVDAQLRTNIPGIWAIGDVVAGPMLAHKAEEDGVAVAEWIAGKAGHTDWNLVPAIIYTDPELATVGLGEDAAKARGLAVNIGKFPFSANGRALASDAADGLVKIIADATTDKLLGAQILGRGAGELISEVVAHMEYGGSAEDLARTIHAHPTMSEAVKEAALAVSKSALHAI